MADHGVELGFPLTRDAYMIASWNSLRTASQEDHADFVCDMNFRTVLSASECVCSPEPSNEISTLVVKHAGFRVQYASVLPEVGRPET